MTGGIGGDGESRWEYFRNVVAVPSIKKTGGALRCAFVPCMQEIFMRILFLPCHILTTCSIANTAMSQIDMSKTIFRPYKPVWSL